MEIPYAVKSREDTGLNNGKLGMWLFLASELMLFGGLFSAFILLKINNSGWLDCQTHLNIPMASVNTLILLMSSMTVILSWEAIAHKKNLKLSKKYLLWTLLLGIAFIGIKSLEYSQKIEHGLLPSTNTFFAIYFALTGAHLLHMILGLVVLAYHYISANKWCAKNQEQWAGRIEVTGLYWHFVDIVWMFLFPAIYLIK